MLPKRVNLQESSDYTALMAFSRLKKSKPSVGQPQPNKKHSEIPKDFYYFYFFKNVFYLIKQGGLFVHKLSVQKTKSACSQVPTLGVVVVGGGTKAALEEVRNVVQVIVPSICKLRINLYFGKSSLEIFKSQFRGIIIH